MAAKQLYGSKMTAVEREAQRLRSVALELRAKKQEALLFGDVAAEEKFEADEDAAWNVFSEWCGDRGLCNVCGRHVLDRNDWPMYQCPEHEEPFRIKDEEVEYGFDMHKWADNHGYVLGDDWEMRKRETQREN